MSIDNRVSVTQVQKAVSSLLSYAAKQKSDREKEGKTLFLEGEEEFLWLVVATKVMTPVLSLKPQRVPLAHPIIDPRVQPICLITKDPQRFYKDLLAAQNINFISRVVDVTKLKGKWAPFEARRQLAGEYGLFLADERVVPLLPKLLGKVFFQKKKQPIPVNLLKKDLKSELESAISSTYLHQNAGTCTSIKVAHTGMSLKKIVANVEKAIPGAVSKLHHVNASKRKNVEPKNGQKQVKIGEGSNSVVVKKKVAAEEREQEKEEAWSNIQSLGIKTHSSVCLPIWSCDLSQRWNVPAFAAPLQKENVQHDEVSESDEENIAPKAIATTDGKIKPTLPSTNKKSTDSVSSKKSIEPASGKKPATVMSKPSLSVKPPKSSSSTAKPSSSNVGAEGGDDDDDTMSEGDEEEQALSEKMKQSSLIERSKTKAVVEGPKTKSFEGKLDEKKEKKRKADSQLANEGPNKKSKPSASLGLSTPKSKPVDKDSVTTLNDKETSKQEEHKSSKSKGDTPSKPKPSAATLTSEKSQPKEENRKAERAKAVDFMDVEGSSANLVVAKGKEKKHKLSASDVPEVSASQPPPKPPAPTKASLNRPLKSASQPPPLKSALKSPSSTLSASDLKEKKAKKASFSVVEKKKDKLGGLISEKGGKSKKGLVGNKVGK